MSEQALLRNAIQILEEKCLFSSARWLCEFIEHYKFESATCTMLQTNLFERYPCNITNEYKKAKIFFSNHSFSKAAETIEKVNRFNENLSFLFLWGYSKYMSFQEESIKIYYENRQNDFFYPYPQIPQEKLDSILSRLNESHSDAFINYLLGLCYKHSNPSKALLFFTRSAKEFPCFWGVWMELVDLVQKRADFIRILQTSKQTIFHLLFWLSFSNSRQDVTFPSSQKEVLSTALSSWWFFQYQLAKQQYHQGNYEKACALLESFIHLDYHDEIGILLSSIYFEMKNELKLTSLASSLTQTQPFSPATKISIACIYHLQHQIDKAYNLYCLAVQILPTSSLLWSLLGQLYIEMAKPDMAIRCFGKCIALSPFHYSGYYHLGLVYEFIYNPTTSIHYYKQACERKPYDPHMRVALGDAYLSIHNKPAAIDCFLVAEGLNEVEGLSSRRLGQLFEEEGEFHNPTKSAYFYRRFLKKKKDMICDDDTFHPAFYLCNYYKQQGDVVNFHAIIKLLLVSNDESVQQEARQMAELMEMEMEEEEH